MIFVSMGLGTSFNMIFSRSMHLPANFKLSFFCYIVLYCTNVSTFSLYIPQSRGHLGLFDILDMTNNVVVNIVEHMTLWYN